MRFSNDVFNYQLTDQETDDETRHVALHTKLEYLEEDGIAQTRPTIWKATRERAVLHIVHRLRRASSSILEKFEILLRRS